MSILDKHPAPWKYTDGAIYDGRGKCVLSSDYVEIEGSGEVQPDLEIETSLERLILAAPILFECVKAFVSEDEPRDLTPFNILIDDIEGTNECDPIITEPSLSAFLAWLRKRGPAPKSQAEKERDELLAALKDLVAHGFHAGVMHFRPDVLFEKTMLRESLSRSVALIARIEGDQ